MDTLNPTPIKATRRNGIPIYLTADGRVVTRKLLADFPDRFAVEGERWPESE